MSDKFPATLGGIKIMIRDINDTIPSSLVKHEFPFKDGAFIENMGKGLQSVSFTCFFWDSTYEEHRKVKAISGETELVHPQYGRLTGHIENMSIRHNDLEETAEIDITFVGNNTPAQNITSGHKSVKLATQAAYETFVGEQTEALENSMKGILGSQTAGQVLDVPVDFSLPIIGQFSGISGKARQLINIASSYIDNGFESALPSVLQPSNSLVSSFSFTGNLPGALVRSIARTAERYSESFKGVKSSPKQFTSSFLSSMTRLKESMPHPKGSNSISETNIALNTSTQGNITEVQQGTITAFQNTIEAGIAASAMVSIGEIFENDEVIRRRQRRTEEIKTFDYAGNKTDAYTNTPLITVDDIENTLSEIRTYVQAVIDNERSLNSLKSMANDLLNHAIKVKLELERITAIEVDEAMPLHVLMLNRGLPYNMAERVYSINNIQNPNFTKGTVKVYV